MTDPEREAQIMALYPLVHRIAQALYRQIRRVDVDDLVGDGTLGLIDAVDSYDASRGMSLQRYARRKILFAMLDGARQTDQLTRFARRTLTQAERDHFALAVEWGRMPLAAELELRHPKLRLARSIAHLRRPLSLDACSSVDSLIVPNWNADPAQIVIARETERSLSRALDRLPARHREVIGRYYLLGQRLADLAVVFSVSKQRIAQLKGVALASVREEVLAS